MIESHIMILFGKRWFNLDLIWNFVIWFEIIPKSKSQFFSIIKCYCEWSTSDDDHAFIALYALYWVHCPSPTVLGFAHHCCWRWRTMTNDSSRYFWISVCIKLTIIGVCKTVVIFARFDSYYVNWTFAKIWHFGKIDLWFDLIWTKN